MTRSAAQAVTNSYSLSSPSHQAPQISVVTGIRRLLPVMEGEYGIAVQALIAVIITSTSGLLGPMIIGNTVDRYIRNPDFRGVWMSALVLLGVYLCGLCSSYFQTQRMGSVGRRVLFNLRNALFTKLQSLPVAFFNQNRSGDLISRINNDTDKLNQFFSQALVQFAGNTFMMTGAGIFLVSLSPRLGITALLPALGVLIVTQAISPWVKRKNVKNLQSVGSMSSEIQESLSNFKVIVAFNRTDYFRDKFNEANERNFASAVDAGMASNIFMPIYGLSQNLAQVLVIGYGFYLVTAGTISLGSAHRVRAVPEQLLHAASTTRSHVGAAAARPGRRRSHFGSSRAGTQYAGDCGGTGRSGPAVEVRECQLWLSRRSEHFEGQQFYAGARQDLRAGRADRRRQNNHGIPDGPFVRSGQRHGPAGRPGYPLVFAGRTDGKDRIYSSGAISVYRNRPRQHCLRKSEISRSLQRGTGRSSKAEQSWRIACPLRAGTRHKGHIDAETVSASDKNS